MGTKTFLYLSITLALLFSLGAIAEEVSGRTADGCTYRVINGQYLTTCPKRGRAAVPSPVALSQPAPSANSGPVTDYGAVPMRRSAGATSPSLPPQQHFAAGNSGAVSSIERDSSSSMQDLDELDAGRRERLKNRILDQTYVGLLVGASNMKESNAGSSTGFGLDIGTNIDDVFGVELGYSYAKQDLNLGLASRGATTDPTQQSNGLVSSVPSATDSSLSSNLFTGEVQAHLTDPVKRLRPYLGAGLGWRSATLSENTTTGLSGGALRQNALGGLATAGTKLRITKTLNLGFAFRYFFPIARSEARLEQPVAALNGQAPATSQLSAGDDPLTGSSQYQVLGGVQYSF